MTERAYLLKRCLRLEWQVYVLRLTIRKLKQERRTARGEPGPRRKQVKR